MCLYFQKHIWERKTAGFHSLVTKTAHLFFFWDDAVRGQRFSLQPDKKSVVVLLVGARWFLTFATAQLNFPVQVAGTESSQPAGAMAASASCVTENKPFWQHFHHTLISKRRRAPDSTMRHICVRVCVFLCLQHTEYCQIHSTSKVRAFYLLLTTSKTCLKVITWF